MRPLVLAAALAATSLLGCQRPAPAAPPPPPPASPAAPVAAPGEPRPFELALLPPADARAGQAATARVVVTAKGAFHVNKDYPMAFRPEPAAAAAFGGERIPLGDGATRTPCAAEPAESCAVDAPLRFTPTAPGPVSLIGTVAFSVCTKEICRIEKEPVTLAVTVAP